MKRTRSISFYAETEEDYIEEYNRRKSISERRRFYPRSYSHNNDDNNYSRKNSDYNYKKKFFQSYDDLELDQLGVNSTFQITTIEKEDSEDNEGGLIQKINNINLSFKQNNISFFSNLAPFTKNIIGNLNSKTKQNLGDNIPRNNSYEGRLDSNLSNNLLKKLENVKLNNEKDNTNEEKYDYDKLLAEGCGLYKIENSPLENGDDFVKRERFNSIIEKKCENDASFLDNININELKNSNNEIYNNNNYNNYYLNEKENNSENYINKIKNDYELDSNEYDNINIDNINNLNINENCQNYLENDIDKNNENTEINDEKKMRRYTFDINSFFPDSSYHKEGEDNENVSSVQNKTLQNFICKNEFLSKNIDFVDEHLKFLVTGSDIKSKHLFLSQLLNERLNNEDSNDESFNITKKIIKILGDYIKLEIYEEDCSLCYSQMLDTYIDFSDGVILIINMDIPCSAKYIYDIVEKLKYKLTKDKMHFNAILLCFEIITVEDFKETTKENNIINNKEIKESKEIINEITNKFELKPNYITFYLNDKDKCLKNEKFELAINKFLSLAYLKKERKNRNSFKNNSKKHKRGITGL